MNIIYMTLNAEAVHSDYVENDGNNTYITDVNESINIWLTALVVFDVVIVAAEVLTSARIRLGPAS